jgi:hypothetical protein
MAVALGHERLPGFGLPLELHCLDCINPIAVTPILSFCLTKSTLNKVFSRTQSFVAGPPTNVQFMVKDAKKYASTGGRALPNSTTVNPPTLS